MRDGDVMTEVRVMCSHTPRNVGPSRSWKRQRIAPSLDFQKDHSPADTLIWPYNSHLGLLTSEL